VPLVGAPATAIASQVASGEVSAREVFEACVAAARAEVNAIVAFTEFASPEPGPLCGVPFTVKDNISVAGLPLVAGVVERRGLVAAEDALAVARLRAAGAVVVGKTNLPPWGGGIETDNEVFGRTSNPHDLARSAGGSSGGAAASVAEGSSIFALGTDSGASVRLPAHFCGVAALKPSGGRVPITGTIDDEGALGPLRDPRTEIGILARTVPDLAFVLALTSSSRVDVGGVEGLRVFVLADDGISPPDADTARVVAAAAAALAGAGARLVDLAPPGGGHALTEEVWASYGASVISYDVLGRWDGYRAEMAAYAQSVDVVLSPVYPTAAPRHGEVANHTSYTTPQNMSGWAAATVPCGVSAEGLPIGVQVAAARDEVALAAALELERAR
jgi:amidase